MVRIKHRYLLVHILYPGFSLEFSKPAQYDRYSTNPPLPDVVQFNRPTPDYVTSQVFIRVLRDQIVELYGDYGGGVTGGLSSTLSYSHTLNSTTAALHALLSSIRLKFSFRLHRVSFAKVTFETRIVKYLSSSTSTLIIRCPRAHYRLVWAALTYITHLPPQSQKAQKSKDEKLQGAVFRVVRVSGTIKKAEEEAIRRARRDILKARRVQENVDGLQSEGVSVMIGGITFKEEESGDEDGIEDRDDEDDEDEEDSEHG
ncbi:hypothetical protein MMC06_000501 [Schaereria dolodes]|nr:hypothetical protein [Schaereria dolodes]